jgi:predicted DsbA family dithiol-disulfide isomerase
MDAYFYENRDVSSRDVLLEVARSVAIDESVFERLLDDDVLVREVLADHNEAVELGITGVPSVVAPGDFVIPGAQDMAFYRRLVQKLGAV